MELINLLRPTVAGSVFVTFAALALHQYRDCRERLQADEGGYAGLFAQEVRRFYPFFPAGPRAGAARLRIEGISLPGVTARGPRSLRHESSPADVGGARRVPKQRVRLAETVAYARASWPYYRQLYRDVPERVEDVTVLPDPFMDRFDDWAPTAR